jgi:hypothetical protein
LSFTKKASKLQCSQHMWCPLGLPTNSLGAMDSLNHATCATKHTTPLPASWVEVGPLFANEVWPQCPLGRKKPCHLNYDKGNTIHFCICTHWGSYPTPQGMQTRQDESIQCEQAHMHRLGTKVHAIRPQAIIQPMTYNLSRQCNHLTREHKSIYTLRT